MQAAAEHVHAGALACAMRSVWVCGWAWVHELGSVVVRMFGDVPVHV